MFDALYPEAADQAIADRARAPVPTPDVPWFKDAWSAVGKALPRAGAEIGRALTSVVTTEAAAAMSAPSMFGGPTITPTQAGAELRQQDAAIRDAIKEMTPDANTTGAASMILHDVTRFVGKASAYGMLGGAPGAIGGMALDEGRNEFLRRTDEGIDPATAAKLGVVKGISSGVAVALPVAGKTIGQTVGLAVAGGPGSFIAEQITAREILENADYLEEAAKIDPFDPMGLGVAFFGSLIFGAGAHGARGVKARSDAKAAAAAADEALVAQPTPGELTPTAQAARAYTQEQVDAAHVTVLQAQREATALHAREDIPAAEAHGRALDRAAEQLATGQRVSVAELAPVDAARMQAELEPVVRRVESALMRLELQGFRSEPPEVAAANFARWFEGSRVVDADGKPLVMYHGTKADFDEFDIKKFGASDEGLAGKGFYLTYNPEEASGYALNEQFGRGDSPNVLPAYVSLKNPLVITQGVLPDGRKLQDLHQGVGINAKGGNALRKLAEDGGHDGVVWANKDGEPRHAVAWRPEQIKSATGNSGRFDPASASLTDPIVDAVNAAARMIEATAGGKPQAEAGKPAGPAAGAEASGKAEAPSGEFAAREADAIAQADPDMLVMMEGMDEPVRAADLLAEVKALVDQEIADAPLVKVAAECALRG